MSQPLVSFLMSVRNDSPALEKCLQGLSEQSYSNLECVIVLDAANPSAEIKVRNAADSNPHFTIITNPKPKNLARSLNLGLSFCKGDYIARIDGDDICAVERIAMQMSCLESLGVNFALVGSRAKGLAFKNYKERTTILKIKDFKQENPLIHPSIIVRKEVLDRFKYNENYRYSQDYELWTRIVRNYGIAILNYELIEFDTRKRNPRYVLTQEFYFLKANIKFLLTTFVSGKKELSFNDFFQSALLNIMRQISLLKNWIRLALGRFSL